MSDQSTDDIDDPTEDVSAESGTLSGAPITSPYKILGEFDADTGVGVLGQNNADSGTPIGVQGAVPNAADGYGVATPDDARIDGTVATTSSHEVTVDGSRALLLGSPGPDVNGDTAAGNVVAGYRKNEVQGDSIAGTISGGGKSGTRTIDGTSRENTNEVTGEYGTIGGGYNNRASGQATVGGGRWNTARGASCTVGGGQGNTAGSESFYNYATVAGGAGNTAGKSYATVGGGDSNTARSSRATVAGGFDNTADSSSATVGGGQGNEASGLYATVPGGRNNTASGSDSFAAGRASATSGNDGTLVWGDGTSNTVTASSANQVVIQAGGGMRIYSDSDTSTDTGVELPPGTGSWGSLSAESAKSAIEPVVPTDVLDRVAELDVATWRYDAEDDAVRHMGPMAEDFADAFGLGTSEDRITNVDADGVALAAIKGLSQRLADRDDRIEKLEDHLADRNDRIDDLEGTVERMRDRLAALESRVDGDAVAGTTGD